MCSACITICPSASNSPVDASRRSLMFDECAERISTTPISSHAARSPPLSTCSSIGSRLTMRAGSAWSSRSFPARRPPPPIPARGTPSRRAGRSARGPRAPCRARARRAEPRRPAGSPPKTISALSRRTSPAPPARGASCGASPHADARRFTSSTLRLLVAVSVARLVGGRERLAQLRAREPAPPHARALRRSAARRTGPGSAARGAPARAPSLRRVRRTPRPAAPGGRPPARARPSARHRASRSGRSRGAAPRRPGRARREPPTPAGRARARSPGRRRAPPRGAAPRHRTASARTARGSMPRSTVIRRSAASISASATRMIPSAQAIALEPQLVPEPGDGALCRGSVEPHRSGQRRACGQPARGAGWRRSPSGARRPVRSRPVPARRPPMQAPRAGRRRHRARRSSRRPRRRCGCPARAGPPVGPRSPVRRSPGRCPPETRQTSQEVPPMSKHATSRSPESPARSRAPATPPAGPESTVSAACRPRGPRRSGRRWTA